MESGDACSQRYPWVEWGVLFRDDKEGQPRFASAKWVDDLVAVNRTSPMQVCACACARARMRLRVLFLRCLCSVQHNLYVLLVTNLYV